MPSHSKIAEKFWAKAKVHAATNGGWFDVDRDSAEHKAWAAYFRSCGWWPMAMAMMEHDARYRLNRIVMPAQWPEWFDAEYARMSEAAA